MTDCPLEPFQADMRAALNHAYEVASREAKGGRRYLDELCRLSCAGDMMALDLFPNAKEISESFAAHNAVRKHLRGSHSFTDPALCVVAVGDGARPRTAATFAFRSRAECWSVDPALRPDMRKLRRVLRLHVLKSRAEDVTLDLGTRPVVVVAVHSHATLAAARACVRTTGAVAVVAIACCVPQTLDRPPDVEYPDFGIMSPKRIVSVWRPQ